MGRELMKREIRYENPGIETAYAFTRGVAEFMGSQYKDPAWEDPLKKFLQENFVSMYSPGILVQIYHNNYPFMIVHLEEQEILQEPRIKNPDGSWTSVNPVDMNEVCRSIENIEIELGLKRVKEPDYAQAL